MHTRPAPNPCTTLIAFACLLGPAAAAPLASVQHLELEVDAERERLRIRSDVPLEPRLVAVDERTVMIALPGAVLAPSAPTVLSPIAQGTVVRVTAFDRARPDVEQEVRVVVQRRPGAEPRLERRGSLISVDFEALARPGRAPPRTLSLASRRTPVKRIVTEVAAAIGETLIFDDAVAGLGVVTIEGPGRFTHEEARALRDTILLLKGFAVVPAPAGAWKVVPISGAPSPWAPDGALGSGAAPVTTLLRLETAIATEIASLITPYLGAHSTGLAFEPTNSLILAGPATRLTRLVEVIRALDTIESGVPVFWSLENADAEVAAEQVREILGPREVPVALGDPRTNLLLLRVRSESLERARQIVERLDRPDRGLGEVQVIRLRYADPTSIAEQLVSMRDPGSDGGADRGGLSGLDFHVVADPATRSLLVRSAPDARGPVYDTVRRLDRMRPTVRMEVTVATLTLGDRLDLGVDAFIPTLTNPKAPDDLIAAVTSNPSGGGVPGAPGQNRPFVAAFTRAPLLLTVIDPTTGQPFVLPPIPREGFALSLNGRVVQSDTLLRPQLLVTSGEEHEVFAGDNVPVRVARTATDGEVAEEFGQVLQDIERYDVGTTLRVTPTVGTEGGVTLDLSVVVSSLEPSRAGPVEDVGPSIREIEVSSKVRLRHGEVAVVASESGPVTVRSETGVPWLKDIPGLGFFFRATTEETMSRHLVVAVQAEILRPEARELARILAEHLGPLAASEREGR